MEQEKKKKKKRAREENEAEIVTGPSFEKSNNNTARKRDACGKSLMKKKEVVVMEEKGCCNFKASSWDSSSNFGLGVFDFPWLKDGVMSKSEQDHCFLDICEDSFLSSLQSEGTTNTSKGYHGIIDFCEEQQHGLCEAPEGGSIAHIPQDKLVEDLWHPFESSDGLNLEFEASEDVDCIWSSLLNKPL